MTKPKTIRQFKKNSCSTCKANIDSITSFDHKIPKPGDVSICVYCGEILRFDVNLNLIKLTELEKEQIKAKDENFFESLISMQEKIKKYKNIRKNGRN